MTNFFDLVEDLLVEVTVDRPRGTTHPRLPDVVYPLDYGHLDGTISGDGAEVDVFIGTAKGTGVAGVLLTADPGKRDVEVKVLLDCSPAEVEAARAFCADVLCIGGHLVPRTMA